MEGIAMAASEEVMEARIARLESDVHHIRSDMTDVKADIRALRDKMDGMNAKLSERMEDLRDSVGSAKVWALILYIALAGGLFGTISRGFGWL